MDITELKFEREDRSGIVAVGTYLYDAARRLGVEVECERLGESDACAMIVKSGAEFLSGITEKEKLHLKPERLKNGERLACQAKIKSAGEITVMTREKIDEEKPKEEVQTEEYRKQFEELPLEKKIASLMQLESIALSETFSFVLNSPTHIVGKIMDVLAEFGLKIEENDKKNRRPREHYSEEKEAEIMDSENSEAPENGGKPKRQSKKSKVAAASADEKEVVVEAIETPEPPPAA